MGTVHIQFVVSAIILLAFTRPNLKNIKPRTAINLVLYGLTLCSIEVFFFQAIARLPIAIVVSICFCGPLFLTLVQSKSAKDFMWLALASVGLVLLLPINDFAASADLLGYLFAFTAAASIAIYIVLSKKLCNQLPGLQGLALGMTISAVATLPFALATYQLATLKLDIISIALFVTLLGIIVPYVLEYIAMAKLETKTIGILSSSEPIIAAVIGLLILGEFVQIQEILAFGLITLASIGSINSDKLDQARPAQIKQKITHPTLGNTLAASNPL